MSACLNESKLKDGLETESELPEFQRTPQLRNTRYYLEFTMMWLTQVNRRNKSARLIIYPRGPNSGGRTDKVVACGRADRGFWSFHYPTGKLFVVCGPLPKNGVQSCNINMDRKNMLYGP